VNARVFDSKILYLAIFQLIFKFLFLLLELRIEKIRKLRSLKTVIPLE